MGRKPIKPDSVTRLRKRTQRSGNVFYYYDLGGKPRKEIALGSDYGMAIIEYAKLEKSRTSSALVQTILTFAYVAEIYMKEVVPTKAPATQKDNARELKQLLSFFNDPPAPLEGSSNSRSLIMRVISLPSATMRKTGVINTPDGKKPRMGRG